MYWSDLCDAHSIPSTLCKDVADGLTECDIVNEMLFFNEIKWNEMKQNLEFQMKWSSASLSHESWGCSTNLNQWVAHEGPNSSPTLVVFHTLCGRSTTDWNNGRLSVLEFGENTSIETGGHFSWYKRLSLRLDTVHSSLLRNLLIRSTVIHLQYIKNHGITLRECFYSRSWRSTRKTEGHETGASRVA